MGVIAFGFFFIGLGLIAVAALTKTGGVDGGFHESGVWVSRVYGVGCAIGFFAGMSLSRSST